MISSSYIVVLNIQTLVTIIKKGTPKKEIQKLVNEVLEKTPKAAFMKFAGALKTIVDPVACQRSMRDEWK